MATGVVFHKLCHRYLPINTSNWQWRQCCALSTITSMMNSKNFTNEIYCCDQVYRIIPSGLVTAECSDVVHFDGVQMRDFITRCSLNKKGLEGSMCCFHFDQRWGALLVREHNVVQFATPPATAVRSDTVDEDVNQECTGWHPSCYWSLNAGDRQHQRHV